MCRECRRGVFYFVKANSICCAGALMASVTRLGGQFEGQNMDGETAVRSEAPRAEEPAAAEQHGLDDTQIQEWLESLDSVLESSGPELATEILERLRAHAKVAGI